MSNLREVVEALPQTINIEAPEGSGAIIKDPALTGTSFLSRTAIPDVQPNTKIIAVCGITDWHEPGNPDNIGDASPQESGWFFSDFYYLHHMFQPMSSDQVWLTCVDPEDAIRKYGQYIHGDPASPADRRVVLDESKLSELHDVRVVPPNDLAERFLSTLKKACQEARESNRPVLIVVCAHGASKKSSSFNIGGAGDPKNAPVVTIDQFKIALGNRRFNTRVCLITTSCYGGGWAINPNLNITSMHAQPWWVESLAWPMSGTGNNRYCGSPFVSGIADTLLRLTLKGIGTEEMEEFRQLPTYAGFITTVRDAVRKLDSRQLGTIGTRGRDDYEWVHNPTFSAQDDEWEMAYTTRTGLPLNVFRERWLQLKAAGSSQEPPGGEHSFGPGERVFAYDQLEKIVINLARWYMNSYPGRDELGSNTGLHSRISILLKQREKLSAWRLSYTRDQIDYRMNQVMVAATLYKGYLGLSSIDCQKFDFDTFRGESTPPLMEKWLEAFDLVDNYPLFDMPSGTQGHYYPKGRQYLAACIAEAGWSREHAEAKLDELVKYKGKFHIKLLKLKC